MKDKEKQSAYMKGWEEYQAKRKQETDKMVRLIQEAVGGCATNWATLIAKELLEHYQPKLSEDSVVLSRQEYVKWLNDKEKDIKEYREIERKETAYNVLDMVDYESNGQTEQITNLIRKRFNTNGIQTLSSKETAEKIFNELYMHFAVDKLCGIVNPNKNYNSAKVVSRLAKQFGVEIKE